MHANPLKTEILFHIGPVPIAEAVVTTWLIMAALVLVSWLGLRKASVDAVGLQTALEVVIETVTSQLAEIMGGNSTRYVPLIGTLFLFLVCANLSAALPGVKAPTAHIETPAALATIVFLSVHYFGIRARGWRAYVKHYLRPNPILLPLNILSELTRTFSLMVRLFGNMMSHAFVLAIIVFLAGLIVPIPFLALGILIGLIQAYIFTVLAAVYIGAAVGNAAIE
jgi:F-type H+-transporting ATPase subunit a